MAPSFIPIAAIIRGRELVLLDHLVAALRRAALGVVRARDLRGVSGRGRGRLRSIRCRRLGRFARLEGPRVRVCKMCAVWRRVGGVRGQCVRGGVCVGRWVSVVFNGCFCTPMHCTHTRQRHRPTPTDTHCSSATHLHRILPLYTPHTFTHRLHGPIRGRGLGCRGARLARRVLEVALLGAATGGGARELAHHLAPGRGRHALGDGAIALLRSRRRVALRSRTASDWRFNRAGVRRTNGFDVAVPLRERTD